MMNTKTKHFITVFAVLSAAFFMCAFLFFQSAQANETSSISVSSFAELKTALENSEAPSGLIVTIDTDTNENDLLITDQIIVNSKIKTLVINGNNKTLDGQESHAFLKIGSIDLTINDITIKNCSAEESTSYNGAVIYADEPNTKITLEGSIFANNKSEYGSGGVVYQVYEGGNNNTVQSNTLTITDCVFINNGNEWFNGGAICQDSYALIHITDSSFEGNYSEESGGAIYQFSHAQLIIEGETTFTGNISNANAGGAIYQYDHCQLTISGAEFTENEAYDQGGAIYQGDDSILTVSASAFTSNYAPDQGGAICQKSTASITVTNCQFEGNSSEMGGAIHAGNYAELMSSDEAEPGKGCYFKGNEASDYGGALLYNQNLTVNGCTFEENSAEYGGAIADFSYRDFISDDPDGTYHFYQDDLVGTTEICNSHFISNTAKYGAAMLEFIDFYDEYDFDTPIEFDENEKKYYFETQEDIPDNGITLIIDETAEAVTESGIKIYFDEPCGNIITISDSEFIDNEAENKGGAIYIYNRHTTEIGENSVFSGNKANSGGAIYDAKMGTLTIAVTVTSDGNGTASAEPSYGEIGDTVTLSARPNDGFKFKKWQVVPEDGTWTLDGNSFTIGSEAPQIKAIFETAEAFTVTITTDGNGTASVVPTSGITGTQITLSAKPNAGFKFKKWQIVEAGGGTLNGNTFTIGSSAPQIKAIFEEEPNYTDHLILPDGLIEIGDSAFEGLTSIQAVFLPDGLNSIGDSAFAGCAGLEMVYVPDSVGSIGSGAFGNSSQNFMLQCQSNDSECAEYAILNNILYYLQP